MRTIHCVLLVGTMVWNPVTTAQERVGAFTLQEARDEASGELRRSISAQPLAASMSPTQGVNLVWICANGSLRVLYTFDAPLRGDDTGAVAVKYRADPAMPFVEQQWWVSSGGRRAVMPLGEEAEINELAGAEAGLVTELHDPMGGGRISHRFDLRGFNEALEYLPCAER